MEKQILDVLQSIDIKLGDIRNTICKPCEDECESAKEENNEEEKIMNFLKGLTEELGLKDQDVIVRKITINK